MRMVAAWRVVSSAHLVRLRIDRDQLISRLYRYQNLMRNRIILRVTDFTAQRNSGNHLV